MNRGGPSHRGNMNRGGGGNMNRGGNRGHPGQVGRNFPVSYLEPDRRTKRSNVLIIFLPPSPSPVPSERR